MTPVDVQMLPVNVHALVDVQRVLSEEFAILVQEHVNLEQCFNNFFFIFLLFI
jgi:hypothetical protein